jgi:transcriptional regulator with XRE-family HTH domain
MAEHQRVRADVFQRRLGAAIRDTREKEGLSRERVANAANLSVRFLFDIEAGLKSPSMRSMKRIADALGSPVNAIVRRAEER